MAAPKMIAVFGAANDQGSTVARCLLKDPQYKVRAITQDISQAQELANLGAQVVTANLKDRSSIKDALKDVHGCFVVTSTDFSSPDPEEDEYRLGENIADVCMILKIQHVVFSTTPGVRDVTGGKARHWDSKARIYTFMKERDLPLTGVMLPFAYNQLLTNKHAFQKVKEHAFKLCLPMGDVSLNMLDMGDLGKAVHYIFNHQDECMNKTFNLVGDKRTIKEMADILSTELRPYAFEDARMIFSQMKALNFPGSEDMANMFEYIQRGDLRFNLDTTRRMVPDVMDFTSWVKANKEALIAALK
ncbi:nmrA-like family domain-containing protein 1 [Amphiura filiformis]|uniref:nmrA-like family domain-containing protein 1 n=1 Tax=Amphiura filiformis TaxID=82378 RepID=UPI003B20C2E7